MIVSAPYAAFRLDHCAGYARRDRHNGAVQRLSMVRSDVWDDIEIGTSS